MSYLEWPWPCIICLTTWLNSKHQVQTNSNTLFMFINLHKYVHDVFNLYSCWIRWTRYWWPLWFFSHFRAWKKSKKASGDFNGSISKISFVLARDRSVMLLSLTSSASVRSFRVFRCGISSSTFRYLKNSSDLENTIARILSSEWNIKKIDEIHLLSTCLIQVNRKIIISTNSNLIR